MPPLPSAASPYPTTVLLTAAATSVKFNPHNNTMHSLTIYLFCERNTNEPRAFLIFLFFIFGVKLKTQTHEKMSSTTTMQLLFFILFTKCQRCSGWFYEVDPGDRITPAAPGWLLFPAEAVRACARRTDYVRLDWTVASGWLVGLQRDVALLSRAQRLFIHNPRGSHKWKLHCHFQWPNCAWCVQQYIFKYMLCTCGCTYIARVLREYETT